VPSHPVPSHPVPSHPVPSHPVPSHPIRLGRVYISRARVRFLLSTVVNQFFLNRVRFKRTTLTPLKLKHTRILSSLISPHASAPSGSRRLWLYSATTLFRRPSRILFTRLRLGFIVLRPASSNLISRPIVTRLEPVLYSWKPATLIFGLQKEKKESECGISCYPWNRVLFSSMSIFQTSCEHVLVVLTVCAWRAV
jgi:hypothetical protein